MTETNLTMKSEKLDEYSVRIFNLQNEILLQRDALDSVMKSGFLNMAQAKYQLGCTRVSMLQVNTSEELKAQSVVNADKVSQTDVAYTRFLLHNATAGSGAQDNNSVRKRAVNADPKDVTVEMQKCSISGEGKKQRSSDPLHWFAVLAPKCLRDCQKDFKQALEINMTIATLQNELGELLTIYKNLRCEKEKLLQT